MVIKKVGDNIADRELTRNEKPGTFIQHYNNGDTGIISNSTLGGYKVDWIAGGKSSFVPLSRIKNYVVIE